MKKLFTLIAFFSILGSASASHMSGGEIWYEFIGDSQNPYEYRIHLKIYRDVTGATIGTGPRTICITSGCFASMNVSLPLINIQDQVAPLDTLPGSVPGSIITPFNTSCIDSNASNIVVHEEYHYAKDVTLQGLCVNYTFSFSLCCRNPNDNLVAAPTFYFEATLNNTLGPNSSPKSVTPKFLNLCINRPLLLSYGATEPDGDSIYYEFTDPLNGNCGGTPTAIDFATGYSIDTPVTTTAPILFNHHSGNIRFTATQPETDVIRVTIFEYRYDAASTYFIPVGSIGVDLEYHFTTSCTSFDSTWLSTKVNKLAGTKVLSCYDSILTIDVGFPMDLSTLAKDGSDFALYNSKDSLVPIVAAGFSSPSWIFVGTSFWLELDQPMWFNDTLTLVSRLGNDLNTLLNSCGQPLNAGDSIRLTLSNCTTGIGLEGSVPITDIKIYPNPASNQLYIAAPYDTRKVEAIIYTANGSPVKTEWLSKKNNQIDIEALPRGLYFISLNGENIQHVSSFQKL